MIYLDDEAVATPEPEKEGEDAPQPTGTPTE